jgi:hypothetical protein
MPRNDGMIDVNTLSAEEVLQKLAQNGANIGIKSRQRFINHRSQQHVIHHISYFGCISGFKVGSENYNMLGRFFCGSLDADIVGAPLQVPVLAPAQVHVIASVSVPVVLASEPIVLAPIPAPVISLSEIFNAIGAKLTCEEIKCKLSKLEKIFERFDEEAKTMIAEIETMKPMIELPEKMCPSCLNDFYSIHDKIAILGCSHFICIDCVSKLPVAPNSHPQCTICRAPFLRQSVRANTWIRDTLSKDPLFEKKIKLANMIKSRTIIKEEMAKEKANYDKVLSSMKSVNDDDLLEQFRKQYDADSPFLAKFKQVITSM